MEISKILNDFPLILYELHTKQMFLLFNKTKGTYKKQLNFLKKIDANDEKNKVCSGFRW